MNDQNNTKKSENYIENVVSNKRGRPKKQIVEEFKHDEPQPEVILVNEETKTAEPRQV